MKLLAILGLCFVASAVAFAGDDGGRICEPCLNVDATIVPMETYQTVAGSTVGQPNSEYTYGFCAVPGSYRFTFCEGGGSATYDSGLSVQPENCGTYLACNDDFCGLQSQLDWYCSVAGNYTIVVDGYSTATGSYVLAYRGPSAPSPAETTAWGTIKALFR